MDGEDYLLWLDDDDDNETNTSTSELESYPYNHITDELLCQKTWARNLKDFKRL